ncbi:MAG: flagellar biosynthetic protein FliR [Pseudomonadales bacterium]|nr:flagellar biosynthetic protein FliR [Pseudomonadales bacterium]
MTIALGSVMGYMGDFIWNLLRLSGFFMTVPIFGNQLVSRRIRIAIVFAVALALTPVLPVGIDLSAIEVSDLSNLLVQVLMSMGLGFSAAIFFQLFVIAGQFIGMQMGLGFAAMVDPGNGVQVTVWSQFFLMLVTLSFLAVNGHLILFEILIKGYQLSLGSFGGGLAEMGLNVARLGGWMFVGGILLAIPAVASLLVVNLSFGIMNRSAPQLNVFALGFPFSLVFGLSIIWFLLHGWTDQFHRLLSDFLSMLVT